MPDESLSPGLLRALGKNPSNRVCAGCGFPLPVYPGKYPKLCPHCGNPIEGRPADPPPEPAEPE